MNPPRFKNPWSTEEEIAAAVRQALEANGWEVHPECGGWDLLAVAREVKTYGVQPGDVLGVECKLDAGTAAGLESLLRQALPISSKLYFRDLPDIWSIPGPHWRAVASARIAAAEVWRAFGVAQWRVAECRREWDRESWGSTWTEWERISAEGLIQKVGHLSGVRFTPRRPPQIPEVVVDVPAGVPSPQTSSRWKIKAVRMMLRLLDGEEITSADFEAVSLNLTTFRQRRWILDSGRRIGRRYVWEAGQGYPGDEPPHLQWPEIAAALRAKEAVGA